MEGVKKRLKYSISSSLLSLIVISVILGVLIPLRLKKGIGSRINLNNSGRNSDLLLLLRLSQVHRVGWNPPKSLKKLT